MRNFRNDSLQVQRVSEETLQLPWKEFVIFFFHQFIKTELWAKWKFDEQKIVKMRLSAWKPQHTARSTLRRVIAERRGCGVSQRSGTPEQMSFFLDFLFAETPRFARERLPRVFVGLLPLCLSPGSK